MKELLGLIAVLLGIIGIIPYVKDIYKGKTKPHLFSNLIWAVVTTIAFFTQVAKGSGPASWTTLVMALLTIYITILCFKYGTQDVTKLDTFFLALGLLSIVPWILTKDPTISVVIATLIDVFGFIPTIRKTWKDPGSETLFTWNTNVLRHAISLFAIRNFVLATYIYPLALLCMNILTVSAIIFGKRKTANS